MPLVVQVGLKVRGVRLRSPDGEQVDLIPYCSDGWWMLPFDSHRFRGSQGRARFSISEGHESCCRVVIVAPKSIKIQILKK